MRDPERIDRMCEKLATTWKECPDLRLCQLVSIVAFLASEDAFYVEDDVFEEKLEKFREIRRNKK